MPLRVTSFYPSEIIIDGEKIALRITRLDDKQAADFNKPFFKIGKLATTGKPQTPEEAEAAEKIAGEFIADSITKYVVVEPGFIYVDSNTESVTAGADLIKLYGARPDVLADLLGIVFLENRLNAEEKRAWKAGKATKQVVDEHLPAGESVEVGNN